MDADNHFDEPARILEPYLEQRAPGDPVYDGLWARPEDSGVRAVIHLG